MTSYAEMYPEYLEKPIKDFVDRHEPPAGKLVHAIPFTLEMYKAVADVAPESALWNGPLKWGAWVPQEVFDAAARLGVERRFGAGTRYLSELAWRMSPAAAEEILSRPDLTPEIRPWTYLARSAHAWPAVWFRQRHGNVW